LGKEDRWQWVAKVANLFTIGGLTFPINDLCGVDLVTIAKEYKEKGFSSALEVVMNSGAVQIDFDLTAGFVRELWEKAADDKKTSRFAKKIMKDKSFGKLKNPLAGVGFSIGSGLGFVPVVQTRRELQYCADTSYLWPWHDDWKRLGCLQKLDPVAVAASSISAAAVLSPSPAPTPSPAGPPPPPPPSPDLTCNCADYDPPSIMKKTESHYCVDEEAAKDLAKTPSMCLRYEKPNDPKDGNGCKPSLVPCVIPCWDRSRHENFAPQSTLLAVNTDLDPAVKRALAKMAVDSLVKYLVEGETTLDFCIGNEANCQAKDWRKAVVGDVEVKSSADSSTELTVNIDKMTLNTLMHVVVKDSPSDLPGVGRLGLQRLKLVVEHAQLFTSFKLQGALYLDVEESDNVVLNFLQKVVEVLSELTGTFVIEIEHPSGDVTLECAISLPSITVWPGIIKLEDNDGLGPSVFVRLSGTPLKPTAGLRLPLRICVEDCEHQFKSPRWLGFLGELAVELAGGVSLNGKIEMLTAWRKTFGLKFLHVTSAMLTVGVTISTYPPTPNTFQIGGSLCLGLEEACFLDEAELQPLLADPAETATALTQTRSSTASKARAPRNDNFIVALAYAGLYPKQPKKNFFIGMISEVTVEKIFGILGDTMNPQFHEWASNMAPNVLSAGFYPPFTAAYASCTAKDKRDPVKTQCFARLSVSTGNQLISLPTGVLQVPAGVQIAGGLKIPSGNGSWTASVDALIGLDAKNPKFYINATMDPFNIGGLIEMGGYLTPDGLSVDHDRPGAQFYLDFKKKPITTAIKVVGAVCIPDLMTCGSVNLWLGKDRFDLCMYANVLGIAQATFSIGWTWTFSRFHVKGAFETDPDKAASVVSTLGLAMFKRFESFLDTLKSTSNQIRTTLPVIEKSVTGLVDDIEAKVNHLCGIFGHAKSLCTKAVEKVFSIFEHVRTKAFSIFNCALKKAEGLPELLLQQIRFPCLGSDCQPGQTVNLGELVTLGAGAIENALAPILKFMREIFSIRLFNFELDLQAGVLRAEVNFDGSILGSTIEFHFEAELDLGTIAKAIWEWCWDSEAFKVLRQAVAFIEHIVKVFPKIQGIIKGAFLGIATKVKGIIDHPPGLLDIPAVTSTVEDLVDAIKKLNVVDNIAEVIQQTDEDFAALFVEEVKEHKHQHAWKQQLKHLTSTSPAVDLIQSNIQTKNSVSAEFPSIKEWLSCDE
jgi:hypothetical protein